MGIMKKTEIRGRALGEDEAGGRDVGMRRA